MRKETRPKVGGQSFPPAKDYVAHGGAARGLGLLFPSPAGERIARCGITELNFSSCAEGIEVGRDDRRYVSRRRKPSKRSSSGVAAVAVGRNGYRRDRLGDRSRGHNDDRGAVAAVELAAG